MKNYSTKIFSFILPVICLAAFTQPLRAQQAAEELAKKEIANAEAAFAKMSVEQGIAEAFYYFADDNATINSTRIFFQRYREPTLSLIQKLI